MVLACYSGHRGGNVRCGPVGLACVYGVERLVCAHFGYERVRCSMTKQGWTEK